MKYLLKAIKFYIEQTGKLKSIFILLFGLLVAFVGIIEPYIFTKVIEIIEEFYKTGIFNFNLFIYLLIFWAIFILFTIIVNYIYRYNLLGRTGIVSYLNLTKYYGEKVLNMSYADSLNKKTGSIYKNFDRGIDAQWNLIFFLFFNIVKGLGGIIMIIILLFIINPLMAIIALGMFPIMIFFGIKFYKNLYPSQEKLNKKYDEVYGELGNSLTNFGLFKNLGLEKITSASINKKLDYCRDKQFILSKGWSISENYTASLVMISRIFVLGFGTYFLIQGDITFATLFLFFSYIGWLYFPLGFLLSKLSLVQRQIAETKSFYDEFDNLEADLDDSGKKIKKIDGNIEFKNVSFGYSKDRKILKKLNFSIKKGEKIALVGSTGAGKSTITNLLLRFWDCDKGEILIDGQDIKGLNKSCIRRHIGIVSQDNSLFNMTIKENLAFAKKKVTKKELYEALKKSESNFVFDLKDGENTLVGERGLKLSGGEKQRLSIARLFLKNPEILILDEATSALDNKTEQLVHKALDKLIKGRTSIIIAHRLSTIKNADKIFLLENGQIVESGTYEELIKKGKKFNELANPDKLIIN